MLGGNMGWLRKTILSEAPKPESNDYQLDDTTAAPPDDEGDNTSPDTSATDTTADTSTDVDEDPESEVPEQEADDYQLNDADATPDEDEPADGEAPTDEGDGTDTGIEDADTEEENNDNLKKLILLGQYRELSALVDSLSSSVDSLDKNDEFDGNETYDYIQDKLAELKSKIAFTLSAKFLKMDYKELLKLFYYYKFALNDLSVLTEKIIEE